MGGLHGFRLTISAGIISCCTWKTLNEQQEHGRVVVSLCITYLLTFAFDRETFGRHINHAPFWRDQTVAAATTSGMMCRSFFVLCCRFGQLCYQSELNRQTECPLLRKAIIRKRYFLFIINKCLLSLLDDLCLWSSLLFTSPPITHTHSFTEVESNRPGNT